MYIITARIIRGFGRGRKLGFPTANFRISEDVVLPRRGIYAAWACVHGRWYRAGVSVGRNKTFHAIRDTIEAHLIGFRGHLYNKSLTLVLVRRLHAMRQFRTIRALVQTIKKDIERIKSILISR